MMTYMDNTMHLTSFSNEEFTESSLAFKQGIGDTLADKVAEEPTPHLQSVEVSTLTFPAVGLQDENSPYAISYRYILLLGSSVKRSTRGILVRRQHFIHSPSTAVPGTGGS